MGAALGWEKMPLCVDREPVAEQAHGSCLSGAEGGVAARIRTRAALAVAVTIRVGRKNEVRLFSASPERPTSVTKGFEASRWVET